MPWVSADYLTNQIGAGQVTALGLSGSVLDQFELAARGSVVSVMQYAGYPIPDDDLTGEATITVAFLQSLVAARLLADAYGLRKGIELPQTVGDSINHGLSMIAAVYNKKLPIPGMEPLAVAGYGGTKFSPSTGTGARPRAFNFRGTGF